MKKYIYLFFMLILGLLSSCMNNVQRLGMYTPQFAPDESSRFYVSTVSVPNDKKQNGFFDFDLTPEGFDLSTEMKSQLGKVLADRGLAASSDSPGSYELIITISKYDSTLNMPIIASASQGTNIFLRCDIKQHGVDMGKIKMKRTYQALMIASVLTSDKWKSIIASAANDIADDLQEKIKQRK